MASHKGSPIAKRRKSVVYTSLYRIWSDIDRLDFSEEVIVLVGRYEKRFTVHKCFLTKTSKDFEICCVSESDQINFRHIKLPKVDPDIFSIYLQWLYTGVLVTADDACYGPEKARSSGRRRRHFIAFTDLYGFAETVEDKAFANEVIDAFINAADTHDLLQDPICLESIQARCSVTSGLYRVIVDMVARSGSPDTIEKCKAELDKEFLFEVTKALMKGRDSNDRSPEALLANACPNYHQQDDKTPTCGPRSDG